MIFQTLGGGRAPTPKLGSKTNYLTSFFQRLCEKERNWTESRGAFLVLLLDPPMKVVNIFFRYTETNN